MKLIVRLIFGSTSIVVLLFFLLSACESEPGYLRHRFMIRDMSRAASDAVLPRILWEHLENKIPPGTGARRRDKHTDGHGEHGADHGSGQEAKSGAGQKAKDGEHAEPKPSGPDALALLQTNTEFVPLQVYLVEKTKGTLSGRNYRLMFSPGGGELDLREFLTDRNGSFYFAVSFGRARVEETADDHEKVEEHEKAKGHEAAAEHGAPAEEGVKEAEKKVEPEVEGEPIRVFFVSNSVRRKIDGETLGTGCNRFYEISTFFRGQMAGDGFLVNTTQLRHVSTLAGTFYFSQKVGSKIHMAQLTVRDSRHRALHCRR